MLGILLVCAGSVLFLPVQPAEATPWLSVSDVSSHNFTTAPNGDVTVGCGDNRDLTTYDTSGSVVRQLDRTQMIDSVPNCIQKPVVDQDGHLYGQPVDGQGNTGPNMLAYEGSTLLWKYPVACSGSYSYSPNPNIAVGVNGNVYTLSDSSTGRRLIGLNPLLQPNQAQPSLVMDVAVNTGCNSVLRPYDDGIAVADGTTVSLYNYSGTLTGQVSNPFSEGWSVDASGNTFTLSGSGAHVLNKYDSTGQKQWDYDAGNNIDGTYAMSDGSVVLLMSDVNNSLMFARRIDGNGIAVSSDITLVSGSSNTSISPMQIVANNKGQLVYVLGVYKNGALSSSVVGVLSRSMRVQTQVEVDNYGATSMVGPGAVKISGDRVFFLTGGGFTPSALVGITVPNVGFDYPRSNVFGVESSKLNYVAMGDSFSSGEGNPEFTGQTSQSGVNECHRSREYAYPTLLADDLNLNLDLVDFVACSGATTDDVVYGDTADGNWNEGSQVHALSVDTDVITVTIGGNDIGFADVIKRCVHKPDNTGWGCSTDSGLNVDIDERLSALAGTNANPVTSPGGDTIHSILSVLQEIAQNAPNASIYIAGYPHLFGSDESDFDENSSAPSGTVCAATITADYDFDDAQWLNDGVDEINGIIQDAVVDAQAEAIDVAYVSPALFEGHANCDSDSSWIYPALLDGNLNPDPGSFHPDEVGMSLGYKPMFEVHLN